MTPALPYASHMLVRIRRVVLFRRYGAGAGDRHGDRDDA